MISFIYIWSILKAFDFLGSKNDIYFGTEDVSHNWVDPNKKTLLNICDRWTIGVEKSKKIYMKSLDFEIQTF
jgi:hypothetical protein